MYRKALPMLGDKIFLTDGGLETTLVFHQGIDLPYFAAFDLLSLSEGEAILRRYFEPYLALARQSKRGMILDSPTWRANPDWGSKMGYSHDELAEANRRSIAIMEDMRQQHQSPDSPMVVSGCIGPRGDGYQAGAIMSAEQARDYHAFQLRIFADSSADMANALTLNYVNEAVGIALAARDANMPLALSFTVETDGRLPDGTRLAEAIESTDNASGGWPAYYMINCAHPAHFAEIFEEGGDWQHRLRGIRANASRKSHAELDNSESLDRGNPAELGSMLANLRARLPQLTILGGCCGTDAEHIQAISHCCERPEAIRA